MGGLPLALGMPGVLGALGKSILWVRDAAVYKVQTILAAGWFPDKIAAALLFGAILISVGAVILHSASREEKWESVIFKSLGLLADLPGADVISQATRRAKLAAFSVYSAGLVTFALLLGVVTSDVSDAIADIKAGNIRVVEKDHVVVLNWNANGQALLRYLYFNNQARHSGDARKPPALVVLSETPKEELDADLAEVKARLGGRASRLRAISRTGDPSTLRALDLVSASDARTVVILTPGDACSGSTPQERTEASRVARRRLLVQREALRSSKPVAGQRVVASVPEVGDTDASDFGEDSVQLPFRLASRRLMAEAVSQPGLSAVYEQLLSMDRGQDGAEFYIKTAEEAGLQGSTFREASQRLPNAVLSGIVRDGTVLLAPPKDLAIEAQDKLLVLADSSKYKVLRSPMAGAAGAPPPGAARDGGPEEQKEVRNAASGSGAKGQKDVRNAASGSGAKEQKDVRDAASGSGAKEQKDVRDAASGSTPTVQKQPMEVAVLNWSPSMGALLRSLGDFLPQGSSVTVLTPAKGLAPREIGGTTFRFVRGSALEANDLRRSGAASKDAVVLLQDEESETGSSRDAKSLTTLRLLSRQLAAPDGAKEDSGNGPRLVAEFREADALEAARHLLDDVGKGRWADVDLIRPNHIEASLLAQVTVEPALVQVFDEVLQPTGKEIYIRPLGEYGEDGEELSLADVGERAALRGEVVLGTMDADGAFKLGGSKARRIDWGQGQRVVVIASH